MPMKTNNKLTAIILLCIMAAGFSAWNNAWDINYVTVYGEDGTWDLRDFDFQNQNAFLRGPVRYVPDALLTPEEFNARENETRIGYPEYDGQYATSRIRVLLPEDASYTFDMRSIDFSERLYVNGEWFWDVGKPGETKESTVPDTSKITFIVQPKDGVVEIVQQAANFVHRESGGHDGWYVGPPGLTRNLSRYDLETAVIVGCYLALFLVHILLYLLLKRYRANLYFALFCLMWFLRSGVTVGKIFSSLAPWMPWVVKFRIEYLAFPVTAVLFVSLLDMLYPRVLHKSFRYALYGLSAVFAALFLFADTLFMSYALPVCEVLYGAAVFYIILRFAMKLRKPNTEQAVFLAGACLFLFSAVWDMFYYNNIIRFCVLGSEWAMLIFAFFAAAAVFIATTREVEEAKAQERRLASENAALDRANRLRGDLMATVSHEISTPLAVMSVYAQLATEALRESGVDEQTTADLEKISAEAKRLADMSRGFLTLTMEQENQKTHSPIAIGPLIEQIARLCVPTLNKNKNRLTLHIAEDLPMISANAGECSQLMWNLLANAARHTRDGDITISARMEGRSLAVTVADTGEGMEADLLPNVFERRREGGEAGHGIGLSICKEIVDAHGGEIKIESARGKGTAVTFTLPERGEVMEYGE